jgi:hypothetical protein
MKKFYLILCILLNFLCCLGQDTDFKIKVLDGYWEWYWTSIGGAAGGHITPEDSGFNITIEFMVVYDNSVNFYLYKNDTLICDTITAILPIDTIALYSINKDVIPCFKKYFYILTSIQNLDYLKLYIEDSTHIQFQEPFIAESPRHYFERKINNTILKIDNENLINIYPNPINDYLYVEGLPEDIISLEIFDISGRIVYKEIVKNKESYFIKSISLQNGIYLIRIINQGEKTLLLFKKIIKI